jgi:hypothetical protein
MGRSVAIGRGCTVIGPPAATGCRLRRALWSNARTGGRALLRSQRFSAPAVVDGWAWRNGTEDGTQSVSTGSGASSSASRSGSVTLPFMPPTAVLDALRVRGGIATVAELAAAAAQSSRAVRSQAARQEWWRPFPGVVGLPRTHPSTRDWICAAALHAAGRTGDPTRDLVAVTRLSALYLMGVVDTAPTRVDLVVPSWRDVRPHPRLSVTRSSHLSSAELTVHRRIPVVRPPALLRDLAAVRETDPLRSDTIELLRRGDLRLEELTAMLQRSSSFPGRTRLRRVAEELRSVGRVDSALEYEARRRFSQVGIRFDRGQVRVPAPAGASEQWTLHLDLGIASLCFGIEVDSVRFHSSPDAVRRDAERANRLALLCDDWRVLHLTWWDLRERWPDFVAMTRAVITAQAQRHLGTTWPTARHLAL